MRLKNIFQETIKLKDNFKCLENNPDELNTK